MYRILSLREKMSKKRRVEEKILNTRLIVQLVAQYGFCCLIDIVMFSKSLDKAFKEWGENTLYCKSTMVVSRCGSDIQDCMHRVAFGSPVLNLNLLKLVPKKWMHVYHVTFQRRILEHPKQIATTTIVTTNPLECYSQVCYVWDGQLVTTIEKELDGRKYYVDHSRHTDEKYHFIVFMKNE